MADFNYVAVVRFCLILKAFAETGTYINIYFLFEGKVNEYKGFIYKYLFFVFDATDPKDLPCDRSVHEKLPQY